MSNRTRETPRLRTSVSRNLSDWTLTPSLRWLADSEGGGPVTGYAQFGWDAGAIAQPGVPRVRTPWTGPEWADSGRFVRVEISEDDGETWTPTWHGILADEVTAPTLAPTPDGSVQVQANGIGALFDLIACNRQVVKGSLADWVILRGPPKFNRTPQGDRSAATVTFVDRSIYILDPDGGERWTARQILDHLAVVLAEELTILIDDPDGALDWIPDVVDLTDKTLTAALQELAPASRACGWTVAVVGDEVVVTVRSVTSAAIVNGAATQPPNGAQFDLEWDDDPWITRPEIAQDTASAADAVEIIGRQPWTAVTLELGVDMVPGWSGGESTWQARPFSQAVAQVHRRWVFAASWDGSTWGSDAQSGIRSLLLSGDASYGEGGLDGTRSPLPDANRAANSLTRLERELPCSPGFSVLAVGQRQAPVIVAETAAGSGIWEEMPWTVAPEDLPAAILLDDRADGMQIAARILAGARILVTLGVREPDRLVVSWRRRSLDRRLSVARVVRIETDAEEWVIPAGVVRGASVAGALLTSPALTIRSDLPRMRRTLAATRAWYANPLRRVRWTEKWRYGTTIRPGTMLRTLTSGGEEWNCGAVVTRVTRRLVRDGDAVRIDTDYETDRFRPDLRSIR